MYYYKDINGNKYALKQPLFDTVEKEINGEIVLEQIPKKGYEEITEQEFKEVKVVKHELSYEKKVEQLVRERYSISQEFAILRQKDTKPDEFKEYFEYVENCKARAKGV